LVCPETLPGAITTCCSQGDCVMKRCIKAGILIFSALSVLPLLQTSAQIQSPQEAPAGFDNQTNGYLSQKQFDDFRETFEEVETPDVGLGPLFNRSACVTCHQNPVMGGGSDVLETRAGYFQDGHFIPHNSGGSLVRDDVIDKCPKLKQELLPGEDHTFRVSVSTLGDGFIEAVSDEAIVAISQIQPPDVRGMVVRIPVLEANNAM